ncbi:MAG: hypothetical protein GXP55_12330, partial [Deltaproteobacteria bacterium]|nr:hypothetical protein [Deltaproteobacteria bacterium]
MGGHRGLHGHGPWLEGILIDVESHLASSFVGRERELAELPLRLERDGVVVVVGLGGVGKSRLVARACPDALWVELADVSDAASVTARVAGAMHLPPGRSSTLALGAELAAGVARTLVLDAAEQVLEQVYAMALSWRQALPELRVLLTSRVATGLPPSALMPLSPLSTAEGCTLFRARAAAAGTPMESECEQELEELVATLDGLPLSIELLASRVRLLGFRELIARARMEVDGEASLPRSLEQVLRFSLDLLDPGERELSRVASVFAGGFTIVDLEQVAGLAQVLLGKDTIDVVDSLLRHSLLVPAPAATRSPRFRLLRAARALILRDSPPDDALLRGHARHFASRAQALAPAWEGVDAETSELLRFDHEDLLLAARRALGSEPELSIAASIGAARWAWIGGSCARPLEVLEQSLGATQGSTRARGRALLWAAVLSQSGADTERAEEHARDAHEMAVELSDPCLMGAAAVRLGGLRYAGRALDEARPLLEQGVRLLTGTPARYLRALGMADLGMLRQEMGDHEAARALLSEARVDALPWPRLRAVVLQAWANQRLEAGDLLAAREALEKSRALALEQ